MLSGARSYRRPSLYMWTVKTLIGLSSAETTFVRGTPAEAVVLNDKLSRSGGYRSVAENGPQSKVSLRTESGFGVRREVGRDDADQERSENWTATIRRLSARTDVGGKPVPTGNPILHQLGLDFRGGGEALPEFPQRSPIVTRSEPRLTRCQSR